MTIEFLEIKGFGIDRLRKMFDPEIIKKASVSTMKVMGRKAGVVAARKITSEYDITQAQVKQSAKTILDVKDGLATAYLRYIGARIGLIQFDAKPKTVAVKGPRFGKSRTGVTVKIRKKRGRVFVKGGFFGQDSNGHAYVFKRKGKERLPIPEMSTLSVPRMASNPEVLLGIQKMVEQEMPKEMDKNIEQFVLKNIGGR